MVSKLRVIILESNKAYMVSPVCTNECLSAGHIWSLRCPILRLQIEYFDCRMRN